MNKESVRDTTFLIPANSKKSRLIFGLFTMLDLLIFGIGTAITFILFMLFPTDQIFYVVIILMPMVTAGFLVFPVPNYHNVRTFLTEAFQYYRGKKKYIWRGWCYTYEQSESDEQYESSELTKKHVN